MSLHRSLKTKPTGLNQHRNVLTRAERVEKLANEDKLNLQDDSPIGLPKVGSRKLKVAGKQKSEDGEGEASEETSDE
ncbi:MAG: small basic protein [Phycisphaerae bacterium]|jgi:small basic protein (TIGR04137 family)|nr:small basic protein [Phycisphaerae bacterium]